MGGCTSRLPCVASRRRGFNRLDTRSQHPAHPHLQQPHEQELDDDAELVHGVLRPVKHRRPGNPSLFSLWNAGVVTLERTGISSRCFFCEFFRRCADPENASATSSETLALPLYCCACCQRALEVGAMNHYVPGLPPDMDAFFKLLAQRAGKRALAVRPHEVPFALFVASSHGEWVADAGHAHIGSDCVICGEELTTQLFYLELRCGHRFHKSCLKPWLETSRSCPTCRHPAPAVTDDISVDDLLRLYPGTDLRRIYETLCFFMANDETAEAVHGLNVLHCYVGDTPPPGSGDMDMDMDTGAADKGEQKTRSSSMCTADVDADVDVFHADNAGDDPCCGGSVAGTTCEGACGELSCGSCGGLTTAEARTTDTADSGMDAMPRGSFSAALLMGGRGSEKYALVHPCDDEEDEGEDEGRGGGRGGGDARSEEAEEKKCEAGGSAGGEARVWFSAAATAAAATAAAAAATAPSVPSPSRSPHTAPPPSNPDPDPATAHAAAAAAAVASQEELARRVFFLVGPRVILVQSRGTVFPPPPPPSDDEVQWGDVTVDPRARTCVITCRAQEHTLTCM